MMPSLEAGMPSAWAKSGPRGITIMKSRMLTNDTAASRPMIFLSHAGAVLAITSPVVRQQARGRPSPLHRAPILRSLWPPMSNPVAPSRLITLDDGQSRAFLYPEHGFQLHGFETALAGRR